MTSRGSLRQLEGMVASGDLGEQERAAWWGQMISAVYARITVAGLGFVGAQLSPIAERHGLALALPEQVNLNGGPDRIRTGDLQRDRLACLATTPRARGSDTVAEDSTGPR